MRPIILIGISLTIAASATMLAGGPARASTFERTPIAPELGVDALTRSVARAQLGRDVFSNPYSAVTLGSVDIYNVFPYVEARTFEVVSDPRWNRLMTFEIARARSLYESALPGISMLSEDSQRCAAACASGYAAILDALEQIKYDSVSTRASVGTLARIGILWGAWHFKGRTQSA